jgi:PPOX class probable F420-dependent enzyme
MELPNDASESILERWPVAALTTLSAKGRPHAVPIVFARAHGALWSPVDGKPKRGGELARIRHVRGDPRVSLLLSHYEPDWSLLWWLRVDGAAEVWRGADAADAVAALQRKYPQYEHVPVLRDDAVMLRIAIRARRSWCASAAALEALLAYA